MVQQARPSGGREQARATRRASAAPSSLRCAAGPVLLLADEGGLEALLDEALADPLDGGDAHLGGLGDAGVRPGGAARRGVGLEQDAGVGQLLGRGLAGRDQLVQLLALLGGQCHLVLLHGFLLKGLPRQEYGLIDYRQLESGGLLAGHNESDLDLQAWALTRVANVAKDRAISSIEADQSRIAEHLSKLEGIDSEKLPEFLRTVEKLAPPLLNRLFQCIDVRTASEKLARLASRRSARKWNVGGEIFRIIRNHSKGHLKALVMSLRRPKRPTSGKRKM